MSLAANLHPLPNDGRVELAGDVAATVFVVKLEVLRSSIINQ